MEKAIKFPLSHKKPTLADALRYNITKWRCHVFGHEALTKKTVSILEEILDSHGIKSRFYEYDNVDITIHSSKGLSLNITKSFEYVEENIILMLYKDAEFGQQVYSVVFNNTHGKIKGIEHMTKGFCINSDFEEYNVETLNPEVLVELLVSQSALSRGRLINLKISNTKKENTEMK